MRIRTLLTFLICFILLLTTVTGYTQLISPPPVPVPISSQLPIEILAGLIGKYLAMAEQYEMMIDMGKNPNSAIKVRISAKLDVSNINEDSDMESDLGSVLKGISKVAFWLNGNMLLKYPSTSLFELSGSFGDIKILTTKDKSIISATDEAVYSVLLKGDDLRTVVDQLPFGALADIPLSINELKFLVTALLPSIANFDNQYEGIKTTPKGMAHVINLVSTDLIITLWILDKTWDLYKAEIYDTGDGSIADITFERIDLIADVPDSAFSIHTSSMAELPYQSLIEILNLRFAAFILSGAPIVSDLYPSMSKVNKGEEIEIISNALDAESEESDLIPLIEYRPPNGSWIPLKAEYVGVSPLGNWKAVFAPKASDPSGDYDLRATYTDKSGNKSETFELIKAFRVIAISPTVISFSPKGDQIPINSTIVVTFDQDMDRGSVEKAFSAVYSSGEAIPGVFQWSGKTMTFIPAEPLKYGSTCNIRILGTAKSSNGLGLDANKNGVSEGSPRDDLSFRFRVEGALMVSAVQRPQKDQVVKGDHVDIDIVIENVTKLSQFSFDLAFNPSVLKVSKIERASFENWRPRSKDIGEADVWLPMVIDNSKGIAKISVSKTRSDGISGTGILATVTFEAIGSGETEISFKNTSFVNILDEALKPILQGIKLIVPEFLLYDANKDGVVDILDVVTIAKGKKDMSIWDKNGDGIVDINDFIAIQADKGIDADANGDGVVDILDLVYILGGAKAAPYNQPLVNELGNSFPNPMNPDAWIPFKLADGGDVVIRIYNSRGKLVRTLDLGYKNPGSYSIGSTSAYWDGKDENGEEVSSGLYFYNIKAGKFAATKKMIVLR